MSKKRIANYFGVKKLYQKSFIQIALWAWITSKKTDGYILKDAAQSFVEYFGDTEDLSWRSISTHYYQIHKIFKEEYDKEPLKALSDPETTYWRKRCEAAEECILNSPLNTLGGTEKLGEQLSKLFTKWKEIYKTKSDHFHLNGVD